MVVDTSSGTPISWESINASGQIPGALVGPALDASTNAVHRQFDATLISRKSAEDECSQTSDGESFNRILIFGGIVHRPKSMLSDATHELQISIEKGIAKWAPMKRRGKVPSPRIGHSFDCIEFINTATGLNCRFAFMFEVQTA